jgi:LmbE family N-acetylglucosaminyl deacetylase
MRISLALTALSILFYSVLALSQESQLSLDSIVAQTGDVYAVFAHADDELPTLGVMSLLSHQYGKNIHWVIVSDNSGHFSSHEKSLVRANEAKLVARVAGLQLPLFINLPDGNLEDVNNLDAIIQKKIESTRTSTKPPLIISNDSRGMYGHRDHIAVFNAMARVHLRMGGAMMSWSIPAEYQKLVRYYFPRVAFRPFPEETFRIPMSAKLTEIKLKAVSAYATQVTNGNIERYISGGNSIQSFIKDRPYEGLTVYSDNELHDDLSYTRSDDYFRMIFSQFSVRQVINMYEALEYMSQIQPLTFPLKK